MLISSAEFTETEPILLKQNLGIYISMLLIEVRASSSLDYKDPRAEIDFDV